MARILTSLHGMKLGLDNLSRLIAPKGIVSGEHGSQYAHPSPSTVSFFDDFLGDVILDQWNAVEGTDSATSDAAILAGGIGGVLRLTTGDAGTGLAADMEQLTQALQWQASNGGLTFECRIKLSAITTCYVFVGFTDLVTLEGPIISAASADTITTNATDAVGWMFDTRMSTDNWWLVGVANDVDATAQNSGYAPVADTYETLRVEVSATGTAVFFRNGVQVGTAMTGALTAATDLTPTIAVSKTSVAASMTADLDYVHVAMIRV
jgi:hypothetical protein